ncbi:MAG: hypothetical protein JHD35_00765 [Sphingopyxis sp.]|nr:hypothetical protein [Sphingopyxis sp.]
MPLVRSGRALFGAPSLLGGQAAKAGLSCASCHINGRGNPHFLLAGISAAPGTADITSSFFSAARGNANFDPATIPDLAMPGKIARAPQGRALEAFIRNLIVEEFGGSEPSAATLNALGAYVRAVEPCETEKRIARGIEDQLRAIDDGVIAAALMAERDDSAGVSVAVAGMRHELGLIAERYAGPDLARERAALLAMSRALQEIGNREDPARALSAWKAEFDRRLSDRLRRSAKRSLYDPDRLARSLR